MEIHLQRIAGAFRRLLGLRRRHLLSEQGHHSSRPHRGVPRNDDLADGGSPRGSPGSRARAERVRQFAAEMGLQAYALMAAAEGAVHAYAHITGEDLEAL